MKKFTQNKHSSGHSINQDYNIVVQFGTSQVGGYWLCQVISSDKNSVLVAQIHVVHCNFKSGKFKLKSSLVCTTFMQINSFTNCCVRLMNQTAYYKTAAFPPTAEHFETIDHTLREPTSLASRFRCRQLLLISQTTAFNIWLSITDFMNKASFSAKIKCRLY